MRRYKLTWELEIGGEQPRNGWPTLLLNPSPREYLKAEIRLSGYLLGCALHHDDREIMFDTSLAECMVYLVNEKFPLPSAKLIHEFNEAHRAYKDAATTVPHKPAVGKNYI